MNDICVQQTWDARCLCSEDDRASFAQCKVTRAGFVGEFPICVLIAKCSSNYCTLKNTSLQARGSLQTSTNRFRRRTLAYRTAVEQLAHSVQTIMVHEHDAVHQ